MLAATWSTSAPGAERKVVVPTAQDGGATWRYTTKAPGEGWTSRSFDATAWRRGRAGFGVKDRVTLAETIGTAWRSPEIYLRKEVVLPARSVFRTVALTIRHDEDVEVYLNGRVIFAASGYNTRWTAYDVTEEVGLALVTGRNVLAVHVSQSSGGQYIDVGLELDPKQRLHRRADLAAFRLAKRLRGLRWTAEKAWAWHERMGPIRGCNYLPRTAVNSTEMWQTETFDAKTIKQELSWARRAGYNNVRVFLQYVVWRDDANGLRQRFDRFLAIAAANEIGVMPILFCDCAFAGREPYVGRQDPPVPGVHNSGWVPSPGLKRVVDRSAWPELERYVKDFVGRFGRDPRVRIWDLYNEPGNSGLGNKSLPLVLAAVGWARETEPAQPITIGAWTSFGSVLSKRLMELSDVVSFHGYDSPEAVAGTVRRCASYHRPVVCTEWLHRQSGNTFRSVLPVFAKHRVGWYHWGLVAGRTQTYMPWGSKKGDPMPKIWQHDVFHASGKPYDAEELKLLRAFRYGE